MPPWPCEFHILHVYKMRNTQTMNAKMPNSWANSSRSQDLLDHGSSDFWMPGFPGPMRTLVALCAMLTSLVITVSLFVTLKELSFWPPNTMFSTFPLLSWTKRSWKHFENLFQCSFQSCCIDCFSWCCNQVPERKQLKGTRLYFG